ncbi:MAG TPA: hypothetical protein VNO50_03435 [Pyrinomonadaceae bacterium]|nr:hypothetical protein [Pyrinomonadaceae bacterium]
MLPQLLRQKLGFFLVTLLAICFSACSSANPRASSASTGAKPPADKPAVVNRVPVIHVFVALCDNVNQGIVPVSASLGNGDNPATNLYWGAAFGVKTFFARSRDWQLVTHTGNPGGAILERLVFKHRQRELFMVADAYRGKEISQAMRDFLEAAAGHSGGPIKIKSTAGETEFYADGSAELVAYIGHNGLMDFELHSPPQARDERGRQAIILACASKQYFDKPLRQTGAAPLVWTTNLMAPEAYVLSAAIDGWMKKETDEEVRARAAAAYHKYQNCGLKAANRLFATGW